jgi:hypothetical protein
LVVGKGRSEADDESGGEAKTPAQRRPHQTTASRRYSKTIGDQRFAPVAPDSCGFGKLTPLK